ncbi:hypothetical protein [Halobacterium litoreum]|uniref:Uncharacterized protein n=1 Tax=Halobacterium litoreum TaxID=2039234 RepID=A0ABD5NCS4_9EURY|nr:hypothetical protein [Halobacterium litoreum]UHH14054.1 hypothetical protein LT972_03410 [Halobacterium litoreum]
MFVRRAVAAVRRPEYTGANRCLPCTVVNLAVVAVAAVGLAFAEPVAAAAVAAVGVALVALRGYVVPGTPTLTKRYLPERVLAQFDHAPEPRTKASPGVEPEAALVAARALEPCAGGDDLCLDSLFRASWRAGMRPAAADLDASFRAMLPENVDAPAEISRRGEAVVGTVADTRVAEWPSRAAFVADAAGASALADADKHWGERGFDDRTRLLAGLRLWLDECPLCDGSVELGEDTVESCCRSVPVVAASCTSCGARIFEAPKPEA